MISNRRYPGEIVWFSLSGRKKLRAANKVDRANLKGANTRSRIDKVQRSTKVFGRNEIHQIQREANGFKSFAHSWTHQHIRTFARVNNEMENGVYASRCTSHFLEFSVRL